MLTASCRATSIADRLGTGFALIHKERPRPGVVGRMVLVGDVQDKISIVVDDIADTSGTLAKAAEVLKQHGAREVIAIVTHGVLSGDAVNTINNSHLTSVVVTNTVSFALALPYTLDHSRDGADSIFSLTLGAPR